MSLRQNTGYRDGEWGLPSGHLEPDEFPSQALSREIREEVRIDPQNPRWCHTMYRQKEGHASYVDFFFVITDWQGEPHNNEPKKCGGLEWFPLDQLPSNTIPYIVIALSAIRNQTPTSEFFESLA